METYSFVQDEIDIPYKQQLRADIGFSGKPLDIIPSQIQLGIPKKWCQEKNL